MAQQILITSLVSSATQSVCLTTLRQDKKRNTRDSMASAKFIDKEIVFQEIPGEISLCYYITNCPHHCKGCHSPKLAEDIGDNLWISLRYTDLYNYSEKGISCVLFMGGDNADDIEDCLTEVKNFGLKTALYSGCTMETFNKELLHKLDYVKIGPYIEELGPLNERTTNQRLYSVGNDGELTDITSKFWKELK